MAYNPTPPLGAAAASASLPVVTATGQVQDVFITGAAAQSTLGNNLLNTTPGAGSIDCLSTGTGVPSYRSFYIQIVGSAGISAGQIIVEGSNDNVTFIALSFYNDLQQVGTILNTAQVIAANSNTFLSGKIIYRYLRVRISTAFVGGTVQAFAKLSPLDYVPKVTTVGQNIAGSLNTTVTQTTAANHNVQIQPNFSVPSMYNLVTTASTNAAFLKATAGNVWELAVSNVTATAVAVKLYNKGSAPTVGTDVPVITLQVPANTTQLFNFGMFGKRFNTGISIAATGLAAATDTTSAVAGVQISASWN